MGNYLHFNLRLHRYFQVEERIKKEVVIIKIESYFSAFH